MESNYETLKDHRCNVHECFSWSTKRWLLKCLARGCCSSKRDQLTCLYNRAESADTRVCKGYRLKLLQCQPDDLLQTSFNLCSSGGSHTGKFILKSTQHSASVTGVRGVWGGNI